MDLSVVISNYSKWVKDCRFGIVLTSAVILIAVISIAITLTISIITIIIIIIVFWDLLEKLGDLLIVRAFL